MISMCPTRPAIAGIGRFFGDLGILVFFNKHQRFSLTKIALRFGPDGRWFGLAKKRAVRPVIIFKISTKIALIGHVVLH